MSTRKGNGNKESPVFKKINRLKKVMLYGEPLFILTGYTIDTKLFLKAINLKKVKWQFFSKYLYLNED